MNPLTRFSIGNLLENMDYCDATRSHESRPSERLRMQAQLRRTIRIVVCCLASVAIATTIAAIAAH